MPSQFVGCLGLASGLEFIHSNKHVHRDLCPRNILISENGARLIISDFGLIKMVHDTGSYSVSNLHGQEKWLAPERIHQKYNDLDCRVTIDSDTCSMGCLFYYFLTKGGYPFEVGVQLQMRITSGENRLTGEETNSNVF